MTVGELVAIFSLKPQGWDKGNKLLEGLARRAKLLIGGEAVRSIVGFVEHATAAASKVYSLSQSTGLTVQQVQELGYVAQQSGSDLKQMAVGLRMAERNLREFSEGRGGKTLRATMAATHTSIKDARDALASPEGLQAWLLKTADTFKQMGNTGKRGAIGTALFGQRAGQAIVADLSRGKEAVEALMARRREMGEMDEKQVMSLRELGNRMTDLKTRLHAVADQVIARLAPAFIEMVEAAGKWISENKDLIGGALLGALKAVAAIFQVIAAAVSYLGDIIHKALGGDTGAIALVVGLAAAIASVLIPALYAMVAPIVMASLPLIGIAAIVGAITYAVLKWGPAIKKGAGEAWEWVREKAQAFWDFISGIPGRIVDGFEEVGRKIKQFFKEAFDYVTSLDWADAIPGIPQLKAGGRALGRDIFNVTHSEGAELDAIDAIDGEKNPNATFRPRANVPAGMPGAGSPTSVINNFNINAPMKIDGSKDPRQTGEAVGDHLENQLRQATRGTGGTIK